MNSIDLGWSIFVICNSLLGALARVFVAQLTFFDDFENERNFRKSDASEAESEFWRPCRGLSPGKGFAPRKETLYMSRRAFLALRVIQRQGKSSFNMLVKKWEKLITKMKISQNL